jgi:tRNA-dihydrouridine synthase B
MDCKDFSSRMAPGSRNPLVSKGEPSIAIHPLLSTPFATRIKNIFDWGAKNPYFPVAMRTHPTLPFAPHAPWLAPLAGYSDLPFRALCRELGAACAETEMVSAKGLAFGGAGTERLLATTPDDAPLVVQLFGAEPEMFRRAMPMLMERGFRHFDLNCGCSVRKVLKSGSGSALMAKPALLSAIVREMLAAAGPGNVGVKLRLGVDAANANFIELGLELAELGVGWLTLHPRTGRQLFGGAADWDAIAELARAVDVPVLASGDLFTAEDAARCLGQTGCAGVMFARGALTDPAIFGRLRDLVQGRVAAPRTAEVLARAALRHIELSRRLDGTPRSFRALRAFLPRYAKGFGGIRALRAALLACESWDELICRAASIAELEPSDSPADHMAELPPEMCGA